jgi:hypothetical protein
MAVLMNDLDASRRALHHSVELAVKFEASAANRSGAWGYSCIRCLPEPLSAGQPKSILRHTPQNLSLHNEASTAAASYGCVFRVESMRTRNWRPSLPLSDRRRRTVGCWIESARPLCVASLECSLRLRYRWLVLSAGDSVSLRPFTFVRVCEPLRAGEICQVTIA